MHEFLTLFHRQTPRLVCERLFRVSDAATVLSLRDTPEFDEEWMRVHRMLDESGRRAPLSPETDKLIHSIEETAFKAVYETTQATGFTEFAPLVSDDFGLIARATAHGLNDSWLNGMFHCYLRGQFPAGDISGVDVSIPDLLKAEA